LVDYLASDVLQSLWPDDTNVTLSKDQQKRTRLLEERKDLSEDELARLLSEKLNQIR
jgi:hypothetical protein